MEISKKENKALEKFRSKLKTSKVDNLKKTKDNLEHFTQLSILMIRELEEELKKRVGD